MPFPNEHALRLRPPDLFDANTFRRTKGGRIFGGRLVVPDSVSIIWAKIKGKAVASDPVIVQALRFDKSKWTVQTAKAWIEKNVKRGIFEPATSSANNVAITDKDLEQAIILGDIEDYNNGEQIPFADIETMESTLTFEENETYDEVAVISAQLHQLTAENHQEDVDTIITTSAASESLAEEETAEAETQNLEGVEIFATGIWRGVPYTIADLDEIAANFVKLSGQIKPPVKLGHEDGQPLLKREGLPAGGWITKLTRIGDKLVADIIDVPRKIARIVKNRGYLRISSEIYTNLEHDGQKHGKVLKAIAFLGGDIPEVKTLEDMVAQYDSADNEYRSVILMADDLTKEVVEEEVTEDKTITDETTQETATEEKVAEDAATTQEEPVDDKEKEKEEEDKEVAEPSDDLAKEVAELREANKTLVNTNAEMKAEVKTASALIEVIQKEREKEKEEKNRVTDESFLTELTSAGKFPPALKNRTMAMLSEMRKSEEVVVTYTEEGNETPIQTTPLELFKELLREWPQGMSFGETASGSEVREPGMIGTTVVSKDGTPVTGEDIVQKVTKYMEANEMDVNSSEAYEAALIAVSRATS